MNKNIFFKQQVLNFNLQDYATLENFYAGKNDNILNLLKELQKACKKQLIYFWGIQGSGRSHLLMASCHHFGKNGLQAAYINMEECLENSTDILESLENLSLLCLDNIDVIAEKKEWEEAIFHFINRVLDSSCNLIVTANTPPKTVNFILSDLKSRLESFLILKLQPLNDEEKLEVLQLRAKNRGLHLPDETTHYLLNNYQRDLQNLFAILDILKAASLKTKRALTIPFVKEVLNK